MPPFYEATDSFQLRTLSRFLFNLTYFALQIYTVFNCVHFPFFGLHFLPYTVQCRSYSKKNCKSVYNYSTGLGAAIKCNPYSETTVESWTHLKTVKITMNIFAVWILTGTQCFSWVIWQYKLHVTMMNQKRWANVCTINLIQSFSNLILKLPSQTSL